jgi:anthranilate synthase
MVGKAVFFPSQTYRTKLGIQVHRTVEEIPVDGAIKPLIPALDQSRGVLLTSSYEYPGRYTRWDIGFINPPLSLESRGRNFHISALNGRGCFLLPIIA